MRSPQDYIDLEVPPGQSIDRVWLRVNISSGRRAHSFRVLVAHKQDTDASSVYSGASTIARSHSGSGLFVTVAEGLSVARKRIVLLNSTMEVVTRLRFQVTAAAEWPVPMVEVAAFAPCGKP